MKTFLKATALTAAIMTAIAGHALAGGPVIIEDTAEAAPAPKLSPGEKIAIAAGLLLIVGILAGGGGGGDVLCNGDEGPADPGPVC